VVTALYQCPIQGDPATHRGAKKKPGPITLECDELWSFVGSKSNPQWIGLALEVETREIVGAYIGDRSRESAEALWSSLPEIYRASAAVYTDFWEAYALVIPAPQHHPSPKDSGKTSHIERLNNTLRQRISRLVRKTLSFSKKFANHVGALWNFIHHYNAQIAPRIVLATRS
jgi:insertion element IS1 protein InsB